MYPIFAEICFLISVIFVLCIASFLTVYNCILTIGFVLSTLIIFISIISISAFTYVINCLKNMFCSTILLEYFPENVVVLSMWNRLRLNRYPRVLSAVYCSLAGRSDIQIYWDWLSAFPHHCQVSTHSIILPVHTLIHVYRVQYILSPHSHCSEAWKLRKLACLEIKKCLI